MQCSLWRSVPATIMNKKNQKGEWVWFLTSSKDRAYQDITSPLKYCHTEDKEEVKGEGQDRKPALSARGLRKANQSIDVRLKYNHLKDDDYEMVSALLHGTVQPSKVPRVKSKVIKMFISSTFTDMEVERNALVKQVFPKLRRYCRDKYGVDFQAVDMRWGVSQMARDDHSTEELCLAELTHCQHNSIGPNFAVLFGQRYGSRCLPPGIVKLKFDALRARLVETGSDVTLLDQCYIRDQNVIPSVYRLQNISQITELTGLEWQEVEPRLKESIATAAKLAVQSSDITADDMRQLLASMTEHEVYQGLINITSSRNRENNTVLFLREIDDLFDNLNDPLAKRFCDVIEDEDGTNLETDGIAQSALTTLKVNSKRDLPRFNCGFSKVAWTSRGVDNKDHIDRLVEHFYHTTRALVDRNMLLYDQLATDDLYHEVVGHWAMVNARCHTFVGREVPLMKARQYLLEESSQALVLHGESGVGKTSFMAKVASLVQSWCASVGNPAKTAVVLRFVGITPKCSSIQQLLHSICHQVAFIAGRPRKEVPEDYKNLKMYFIDVLQRGELPGMLVILLDSLDQLSSGNGAHLLDWMPARLASNVKVIITTLPTKHGILERLQNKVAADNLMQLSPLPTTDAERIIKVMLDVTDRQVTLPQWRLIQEAFQHCTLPLFITLTFQEAARWRSYENIPRDALQKTVEASILQLFQRLETKHGKTFVSRALAYITAARQGLSESELEDVLSLDEDVLASVFVYWLPPVRRVPPSLWPRLYLDISAFLVERDADDVTVLSWYHQQFVNAATTRYLSDYVDYVQVHRVLTEYYMGTWSGSAQKPFTYSARLMSRLKVISSKGKACRYVPDMPLVFHSSEVSERFNLRKMSQLPYSLLHSRQFQLLRSHCLCNYEWLHAKLRASSVQQVLADFALFDDRETDLVADVLRMAGTTLGHDPDRLAVEISGRLLPHVARYDSIRELVKQCDLAAQMSCPLVPLSQLYAAPGGPLQYECDLEARSAIDVDVFGSPDGILMTAKSYYSKCLKVWELSQGEPRQDIHLPVGAVHPTSDGRLLAILRDNRHVSIYKTDSGELRGHVDYEYGEVGAVATGKQYMAICVERGVGPVVVDVQQTCVVHRFAFHSHAAAFSPDQKLFCFNSGRLVLLYTLPLLERKCVGQAADIPVQISFTGHSTKCFLLTQTKMLQSIRFDIVNRKHRTNDIVCDLDMRAFTLSHNENLVLCRSLRCLYLIDAHRERLIHRLHKAPDQIFTETMTTFSGAGFTPDDRLVVAARHTYLFVWNAGSGNPIRVLQAALSPLVKLFMSPATNKAVTLLQDNTLQVWNLNNLDADVLHANEILKGAIKSLEVNSSAGLVACHGGVQGQAEVKLVEISTGRVVGTLQQPAHVDHVSSVTFSCNGRYVLTVNVWAPDDGSGEREATIDWPLLRCVVLWDTEKHKSLFSKVNSRFSFFDRHGYVLGIVQCVGYSRFDWTDNVYEVSYLYLDMEASGAREQRFELPANSELMGCPTLYYDRRSHTPFFVAVLQLCHKTFERPTVEGPRRMETVLYVRELPPEGESCGKNSSSAEPRLIHLSDLLRFPDAKDRIANVRLTKTNLLMITYVKGLDHFNFDSSRGLVVPHDVEKGCVLYDVRKDVVVKHNMRVFSRTSDIGHVQMSDSSSISIDQNLQVFDMVSVIQLCKVPAHWHMGSARLALDGRYVVGLSSNCRSVQVYRTADGVIKGSLLVHGKATCLEVAEDGRTIALGTADGRVMLLSLVLDLSDPYVELIQHFPSRNPPPPPTLTCEDEQGGEEAKGDLLVHRDAQTIRGATPELMRLSAKIRSDVKMAIRHQSSFRSISNAMIVAQKFQQGRSQACCIQ